MATFFVNGQDPVEVVPAAGIMFLQVVSGKAFLVEGADPTIGFLSQGETHYFNALTAAVTAINASPSGYSTIRTSDATQVATATGGEGRTMWSPSRSARSCMMSIQATCLRILTGPG